MSLRHVYHAIITEMLDRICSDRTGVFDTARDAVAAALAADRLVHVVGSGHSHMIAEEVFYRAGGIAAAQAILEPDLMLHAGAFRSTLAEREEGRAEKVMAGYAVTAGDVVFIVSNSGHNAFPIEMAMAARQRGATTFAVTSMRHADRITSRHGSGKLLHEIVDHVIDNGAEYGDSALPIAGRGIRMGPTSSLTGIFILNAVMAEAVELLAARGIEVDVYQSANMEGAEDATEALVRKWRDRIRRL